MTMAMETARAAGRLDAGARGVSVVIEAARG